MKPVLALLTGADPVGSGWIQANGTSAYGHMHVVYNRK
jgi:hypothetical protein